MTGCLWDEAKDKPVAERQAAVQLLHQAGFVHCDFRCNNIPVVSGTVRIIDFEWAGAALLCVTGLQILVYFGCEPTKCYVITPLLHPVP